MVQILAPTVRKLDKSLTTGVHGNRDPTLQHTQNYAQHNSGSKSEELRSDKTTGVQVNMSPTLQHTKKNYAKHD